MTFRHYCTSDDAADQIQTFWREYTNDNTSSGQFNLMTTCYYDKWVNWLLHSPYMMLTFPSRLPNEWHIAYIKFSILRNYNFTEAMNILHQNEISKMAWEIWYHITEITTEFLLLCLFVCLQLSPLCCIIFFNLPNRLKKDNAPSCRWEILLPLSHVMTSAQYEGKRKESKWIFFLSISWLKQLTI